MVVENDGVSTKIIQHLSSRVTFTPLNRVQAPHVEYPQSSDAIPLMTYLKFDSKFSSALGQVLASSLLNLPS